MNYLGQPNVDISAKDLFEICAKRFRDKNVVNGLLKCSERVENDADTLKQDFPNRISEIKKLIEYPNGISIKEFKNLYKTKFVEKDSPGRKYYDLILSAPKGKICPICGERVASNLDHYLPESLYATLVVTPNNLIPICKDCNFDKLDYEITGSENSLLHPYFDQVDEEVWLKARLLPDLIVEYYTFCPSNWPAVLKQRVNNHMNVYKLSPFYAIKASQEIADSINRWESILTKSSKEDLYDYLVEEMRSKEANHLNSWKTALYRGLVEDFETVVLWLSPHSTHRRPQRHLR